MKRAVISQYMLVFNEEEDPEGMTKVPEGMTKVPEGMTKVPEGITKIPEGMTLDMLMKKLFDYHNREVDEP
jgi:hypothetical protein